jgi:hypothetical protein
VGELTEEQYNELLSFAETRLGRGAATLEKERVLAGIDAGDLVHGAYEKLLLGDTHPKKGQRLPAKSRLDTGAFVNYVKSVINSDLQKLSTSLEASAPHVSWSEPATGDSPEFDGMA